MDYRLTPRSNEEYIKLCPENPTEMANFYSAMAYPGSPLYAQARKDGVELPKTYAGYSQHSYETLNLRNNVDCVGDFTIS